MNKNEELKRDVAAYIARTGASQSEIARRAGVSPVQVSRLMAGRGLSLSAWWGIKDAISGDAAPDKNRGVQAERGVQKVLRVQGRKLFRRPVRRSVR